MTPFPFELTEIPTYVVLSTAIVATIPTAYLTVLKTLQLAPMVLTKSISSQNDLEKIVKEEAKKLNLDPTYINSTLEKNDIATTVKEKEQYKLTMGGEIATRSAVKHELYHIKREQSKKPTKKPNLIRLNLNAIRHAFIDEVPAIAYQYGIKFN